MSYEWILSLSAPMLFPVCADWFYVKYDKIYVRVRDLNELRIYENEYR